MGKSEAPRTFSLSLSSLKRYAEMADQGLSLAPQKRRPGSRPKTGEDDARRGSRRPTPRGARRRYALRKARVPSEGLCGVGVSDSTVSRLLKRMGFTRKKRVVGASERDLEFLRAAPWRVCCSQAQVGHRSPALFVDEMGANTSLSPLYAWSRRGGERARGKAARKTAGRTRRSPGEHMSSEGIGPSCLEQWKGGRPRPSSRRSSTSRGSWRPP
jgi:hypothetical protein